MTFFPNVPVQQAPFVTRCPGTSSHEIMWSGLVAGSASFNSEAAAVGTPGAIGRDQTGSFRLFGLFSLSRSLGCLIGKSKKHKTNRLFAINRSCSSMDSRSAMPSGVVLTVPASVFFHDTALDHMAAMDENESPVEVHLTKN